MPRIRSRPLPDSALLRKYFRADTHTDCFTVDVDVRVSQEQFVAAFYTTWLFKLERWILGWAVNRPSTDAQALELALGLRDRFAAWDVEGRSKDQLLLCDLHGRTRSWLMTSGREDSLNGTRLYFGSAVVPVVDSATGTSSLGIVYRALLGFHRVYSHLLLRAARSKLAKLEDSA